jgi:pyrroline-5-carboxylate reductase
METKSLGFIGAGRVTRIFLQAFKNRKVSFRQIRVIDPDKEVLKKIKKEFPHISITNDDLQQVMRNDIVFIALHPPVIMEMLEKMKPLLAPDTLLVSLAPKITIEKISLKLDGFKNIARLIPNAPSVINEGFNPAVFSNGLPSKDRQLLTNISEVLGKCIMVEEPKLEAYAIITAMLPTYFWFQFMELCDIGIQLGLSENECREGIRETIKASVDTLFSPGMTSEEVIDLVPVKPITAHETEIKTIYRSSLIPLFEKIKP